MGYLAPGLYSVIPQLDASTPKDAAVFSPEPEARKGQIGYHRRPAPQKVEGADDATTISTSAADPTGWRNYPTTVNTSD